MQKFIDKVTEIMVPISEKVQNNKFLSALSEAMMTLLAVTMVGAFGCLFAFLDIGGYQAFLAQHAWIKDLFKNIQSVTLTIISLYVIVTFSYNYSGKIGLKNPMATAVLSLAAFLCLTPVQPYASIPMEWFGHKGLFSAMIVGWAVPHIVRFFQKNNITIKMPAGVPRAIEASFATLIPALVICVVFMGINRYFQTTSVGSFHNIIYTIIQAPFKNVGGTLPVLIIMEMMSTLAMFMGIHGSSVTTWYTPIQTALTQENLEAYTNNQPLPNIIIDGFTNTITIGGIGATLALVFVVTLVVRSKRYKEVNRVALVPQIFNICEPYLFRLPIMLNPILFIPYIGGVLFNCFSSYILVRLGIIARFTGISVAWTVPSFIKTFLTCSVPWQGLALCLFNLAIDCLMWVPFLKIMDNQALKEEAEAQEKAVA